MPPMATTTTTATDSTTRRFAVACGVLSQYVKAAEPMPPPGSAGAMVLSMGGVQEPSPPAGDPQQQLTIFYGGRVVVLDGCTPAMAAELVRYAASAAALGAAEPALVDLPIARKASLQRFLAKRKERATADRLPCGLTEEEAPAKKARAEASSWLALGSLGDMHAQ